MFKVNLTKKDQLMLMQDVSTSTSEVVYNL